MVNNCANIAKLRGISYSRIQFSYMNRIVGMRYIWHFIEMYYFCVKINTTCTTTASAATRYW